MKNLLFLIIILLGNYCFGCCSNDEIDKSSLLVFTSSSMPKESLKAYYLEVQKYEGILVINGLLDNSFIKTRDFLKSVDEAFSVQINDELFSEFSVTRVPAIVLVKANQHDIVIGNISIRSALEIIARNGSLKQEAIEMLE